MTNGEKQKAIDALKISALVRVMTQEEFNDYIQTINQIIDWLEQKPTNKNSLGVNCIDKTELLKAMDTWDKFGYTARYGLERLDKDDKGFVPYVKYDDMVNCVKNMHSVTPQEPVKSEPMQVDLEGDGYADGELVYDYGKCPKCGWEFEEGDKDWEQQYCCHCGQKLKWFDNEAESEIEE